MATMSASRSIPTTLLVLLSCVQYVWSQCGTCLSSNSVACVSRTGFKVCYNGVPSGDVTYCPTNTVCVDDSAVCLSSASATPACISECGVCGADLKFACVNSTTYAFCFGSSSPTTVYGNCPSNLVCSNSDPPNFCVDPTQLAADCQPTTTTPAPGVCSGPGRFPLPGSTNCKQYVYCFYNNFVLKNQTYTCQGTTIFYAPMQQCVPSSDYPCVT